MQATSAMFAPAFNNEKALMRKVREKHDKHSAVAPSATYPVSGTPLPKCPSMRTEPLLPQDVAVVLPHTHTANVLILLGDDDSQFFDSMCPSVGLSRMDSMRPVSVVTDLDIDDECFTPILSARAGLSFTRTRSSSRQSRACFVGLCDEPSTMSRKGITSTCPESILTEMSNDCSRTACLANLPEKLRHQQQLGRVGGMPFVLFSCDGENDGFVSSDNSVEVEDATSVVSHAAPSGHRAVSWRRLDSSCSDIEEEIDGVVF